MSARHQAAGRATHVHLRARLGEEAYRQRQQSAARAGGRARQAQLRAELGDTGYRDRQHALWQRAVAKHGVTRMRSVLDRAREQRRVQRIHSPTPAEALLQWALLQQGFTLHADCTNTDIRSRCWQPSDAVIEARIGPYACDLCIPALHLVFEVVGGVHCLCVERDARRREALETLGFSVIEIANERLYHANGAALLEKCLASREEVA